MSDESAKLVPIDDVLEGSKFDPQEAVMPEPTKEDVDEAIKWWKSLSNLCKVEVYLDYQNAMEGLDE